MIDFLVRHGVLIDQQTKVRLASAPTRPARSFTRIHDCSCVHLLHAHTRMQCLLSTSLSLSLSLSVSATRILVRTRNYSTIDNSIIGARSSATRRCTWRRNRATWRPCSCCARTAPTSTCSRQPRFAHAHAHAYAFTPLPDSAFTCTLLFKASTRSAFGTSSPPLLLNNQ